MQLRLHTRLTRGPGRGTGAGPRAPTSCAVLEAWPPRLPGHQWAGMFPRRVYFVLGMGEGGVGAGLQGPWVLEGSQLSVPREPGGMGEGAEEELPGSQAGQLRGIHGTPVPAR